MNHWFCETNSTHPQAGLTTPDETTIVVSWGRLRRFDLMGKCSVVKQTKVD
jgi:hypothetical protein